MEPPNEKSGELERRISTRNSIRISINGAPIDGGDDDHDLIASTVSDGFRPSQSGSENRPSTPSAASSSTTLTPSATESLDSPPNPSSGRPSSSSKPHRPHESFSLRHDGGMGPIDESSILTRTSSLSTDSASYVPGAESPYHGPSGPSHPYEMYTQNVRVARTMSMTTTSTLPVSESSYNGPRAPTHPYGLYAQDTAVQPSNGLTTPIPLGFHGLPDQYQRRMGPEGEEIADIIGPDGHTEQLPPYTRYPDEAYARKVRDVEESPGASVVPVAPALQTSGLQAIPGAGGIGLATRNPEFESMDDLGSPQSRHSTRSFTSDGGSSHEINMAAAAYSEKGAPQKPWQTWMRKRIWGIIPVWSVLLTAGVLLLMGVILGSVIGTFVLSRKDGHREGYPEPGTSPTASITFDATPIPTPTDLPPLPLGSFSMPIITSRQLSACFTDTTLTQAWQCHLVISFLKLTIAKTKEDSQGNYTATITCNTSRTLASNVYSYGEQPFLLETPASLELVNDTFDTGRGPAWFKLLPYDKTVIVPEGVLNPSNNSEANRSKIRDIGRYPVSADFKRKGVISEGNKPWICKWPDTYLEIFIYAQQNSSYSSIKPPQLSSGSSSSSSSSTTSSTTAPPGWSDPNAGPTGYAAAGAPGAQPTNWAGGHPPDGSKPTPTSSTGSPTTSTDPPSASSSMYGPIDLGDSFSSPPPPAYPRVIKIEERHMYGNGKATCSQVEIQDYGQPAKPVIGPDGKPVVIEILENAPSSPDVDMVAGNFGRRTWPLVYRDSSGGSDTRSQCGCTWFLT